MCTKKSPRHILSEGTHRLHGWMCHRPPPARSDSARRALSDRAGSTRIGRRSLAQLVPSISDGSTTWATRTSWWWCWHTFSTWVPSSAQVDIITVDHSVKVWASHSPSQPSLPLTSLSSTPQRWVHSHSLTANCARWLETGAREVQPASIRPHARWQPLPVTCC